MEATPPWLSEAFKSAKEEFKQSLKNPALYDFSKISSIDDVLDEVMKIEREQAKTKTLRGLKRLEPLINGLKEYSAIIEVFVQAKPDVMSFIWGPLKFILQASSSLTSAFEKVVKVIADLGITFPSFKTYAQIFHSNHEIRRALCLFYADILDFYAVLLNFLTNRRLNIFLEPLWPNIRSSIAKIQENIDHHKTLMTMNVTLQDILQAHQARKRALEEYEHAQAFRDSQTFSTIRNELNPHVYDAKLTDILRRSSVHSGKWLDNEPDFLRWLDSADRTVRCMWLYGIPGCGKTFLVSNLIKKLQTSGQRVLFAFLSHDNQPAGDTVKVFHSFLFQALEDDTTLRPLLHDVSQANYRKLKSDSDSVLDLLCSILRSIGPSFIILDGLDELDEVSWQHLLSGVLKINENCPETKLLISSREERGISLRLGSKASLRVDHRNLEDIKSFVRLECDNMLLDMGSYGADEQTCIRIKEKLYTITGKAEGESIPNIRQHLILTVLGMFIYARLVLLMVKDQGNIHDIEAQMEDLPEGLDQVYGRLLTRIKSKLTPTLRTTVRTILQWVACAQRPLTEEEMLQILVVEPGQPDFTKGRKDFRDIRKACGPIIEINEDSIRFVHFSAKEYLLHEQSNSFLNLSEAHADATLVCVAYLTFSSLNGVFSSPDGEVDLQKEIMSGDYVLFEYASMMFLEHLKPSLGMPELDRRLVSLLSRLREIRSNRSLDISNIPKRFAHMFKSFADMPELQALLSAVAYSQAKAQLGLPDQDGTVDSPNNEPLELFSARHKFRTNLEGMLCHESDHEPGCRCEALKHLYGTKIYHCDQQFCDAYRTGFESKLLRDQHSDIHRRLHKCSVTDCLFAEVGFCNAAELQRHMSASHPSQISREGGTDPDMSRIPHDMRYHVLRDAVMLNQIGLQKLIPMNISNLESWKRGELLRLASRKGSTEILSYLFDEFKQLTELYHSLERLLAIALEVKNLPNIKFLLGRGANMSTGVDIPEGIFWGIPRISRESELYFTGYGRALSHWSPDLMSYLTNECHVDFAVQAVKPRELFYNPATRNVTLEDARKRFEGIKKYIIGPEEVCARGAVWTAIAGNAVGTRICLENGGDPNALTYAGSSKRGKERCALYYAVKSGTRGGAETVKALLQYGADPESQGVRELAGMKKIERYYFGFAWEEIVSRIQAGEDLAIAPPRNKFKARVPEAS
ncbi:hypothetical protein F4677DRAFT_332829 [Hypoxylon crocopeplum]|nr:hypothetical protein F4677DRAFT_332829 [Hypoxylon crocopeplum]